jgi:hypothetical protein
VNLSDWLLSIQLEPFEFTFQVSALSRTQVRSSVCEHATYILRRGGIWVKEQNTLHSHHLQRILNPSSRVERLILPLRNHPIAHAEFFAMADQLQEILDVPREFLKDGMQFIHRSQKRESCPGAGDIDELEC